MIAQAWLRIGTARESLHLDPAENELDPPSIALSASAKAAWVAFHNDMERSLGPGRSSGHGPFAGLQGARPNTLLASRAPASASATRSPPAKAKGMWMGGVVPLGYRVDARRRLVEPAEAETVRTIFARFATCRSTTELVRWLTAQGIASRRGTPFSKQALWKLLNNRIYLGEIVHRGRANPGQHEAIVDAAAWAAVQPAAAGG